MKGFFQTPDREEPSKISNPGVGVILVLFLAAAAGWFVSMVRPPEAVPASAAAELFSAARAFEHVQALAGQPRPVGSPANAQARAYLIRELEGLGLQVEVQAAFLARNDVVAQVMNVAARLPGRLPDRAILLVAHYDSVPNGPGANDNTTAVAALLETARALAAGEPLQNSVIFLFTDMEEMGLWGAEAFFEQHPWMDEVGLVFNFEARGSRGPVYMFETTPGNRRMIAEFAQAVAYPFANSMMYEIYRQLPNDTDFTIFKKAGIPGGGVAYINDAAAYHSERDNAGNVSLDSLQHHGGYALGVARHFGNLDLADLDSRDNAIYFDLLGRGLVDYPESWAPALALGAVVLFAGVMGLGWRKGQLSFKGMGLGFGLLLASVVLAGGAAALVWWGLTQVRADFAPLLTMDVYRSEVFLPGFVGLAAAILSGLFLWVAGRLEAADPARGGQALGAGALLVWLVLTIVTTVWVPGGSFLFLWPLVFALLGLGLCFALQPGAGLRAAILGLTALPGLALVVPLVPGFYAGLTIEMAYVPAAMAALTMGLVVPHLVMLADRKWGWALPTAALAAGVVALLAANWLSLPGPQQPRPSGLMYGLDADTQRAYWMNSNDILDEWNSQFLDGGREPAAAFFPDWGGELIYRTEAETAALEEPQVVVLEDSYQDGLRRLRLHVRVRPEAITVAVHVLSAAVPKSVSVEGVGLENWYYLDYWAPPAEGFEMELAFEVNEAVEIRVIDRSWGLEGIPGYAGRARPQGFMALPRLSGDVVMVTKRFVVDAVR